MKCKETIKKDEYYLKADGIFSIMGVVKAVTKE